MSCRLLRSNLLKLLSIAADMKIADTDVPSDIFADPACDPTLELAIVGSEQAGESSSSCPGKYGGKDALALSTDPYDVGSKAIYKKSPRIKFRIAAKWMIGTMLSKTFNMVPENQSILVKARPYNLLHLLSSLYCEKIGFNHLTLKNSDTGKSSSWLAIDKLS